MKRSICSHFLIDSDQIFKVTLSKFDGSKSQKSYLGIGVEGSIISFSELINFKWRDLLNYKSWLYSELKRYDRGAHFFSNTLRNLFPFYVLFFILSVYIHNL